MWGILIHVSKWAYKWSLLLPNKISDSFIFSLLAYGSATSLLNYIGMTIVLL